MLPLLDCLQQSIVGRAAAAGMQTRAKWLTKRRLPSMARRLKVWLGSALDFADMPSTSAQVVATLCLAASESLCQPAALASAGAP